MTIKKSLADCLVGNSCNKYLPQIVGCSAALSSETGKIGYVEPLINAEIRRLASASYLGAKS